MTHMDTISACRSTFAGTARNLVGHSTFEIFPRNLGFGGADPDREIVQALSILTSDGGFSPANLAD